MPSYPRFSAAWLIAAVSIVDSFVGIVARGADATPPALAKGVPEPVRLALQQTCYDCHNADVQEGQLNLAALTFDLADAKTFARWVKVYDRVEAGEMPPKDEAPLADETRQSFLSALSRPLVAIDAQCAERDGRATWRRLNRYEYENTLRDLLGTPWLQIKEILPEDGEAFRFNKVGTALDVSHVQIARYLSAADYASRGDCQGHCAPAH